MKKNSYFRCLIPQENYHSGLKSSNEDPDDYNRCNSYLFRSEPRLGELTELNLKSPDEDADADNFRDKKNIFLSADRLRELTEPVDFNSSVATKQGAPS